MRITNIGMTTAAAIAAAFVAGPAAALPGGSPGAAVQQEIEAGAGAAHLQNVRYYRRGFPVYALGPYPSGFGDERRTGRAFYAGRGYYGYGYRHHRGYYWRY